MQFARPPDGFRLRQKQEVLDQLDGLRDSCPWLDRGYGDAVARLRMSGRNEGRPVTSVPGLRSVVEMDPLTGRKRLGISYRVLGDSITIYAIRVLVGD